MPGGPTPPLGVGPGLAAPWPGVAALWLLFDSPSDSVFVTWKYELRLLFHPISRIFPVQLSGIKNSRKQELALRHLVNRLVPKNA